MNDGTLTLVDRKESGSKMSCTSENKKTEIKLRAKQQFELVLKNDAGNIIPFQKVSVTLADGYTKEVRVDENGYYKFTGVPEGNVRVRLLDPEDIYSASHAANLKKAFQSGKEKKDVVFEGLKIPPLSVKRMVEIYDEQSRQSRGNSFIIDLNKYSKNNLSGEERLACYALLARAGISTPEKNAKYFKDGETSINYGIAAEPHFKAIIPETKVKYYAGQKYSSIMDRDSKYTFQWFCFNDPSSVKSKGAPSVVIGPASYTWEVGEKNKWKYLGNHTLCCRIQFLSSSKQYSPPVYLELQQGIKTEEAILNEALLNYDELPDPDNSLLALSKFIEILETAEKMPDSGKLDPKYMKNQRDLRDKMKERFKIADGKRKYPIKAVHIDKETSRVTLLRVFISFLDEDLIWDDWVLVDWTNVADRRLTGVYEGEGRKPVSAIEDMIKKWDSGNRYPPGKIKISIPANVPGGGFQKEFTTDGSTFWDSASSLLSYVALGGAVVAGVVTLIAPVPGSRIVSFAIWSSIAASTASATINIGQRHSEGFGDFKEDALDSLTIVGNLMTGGWMQGAKVVGLRQFAGSKMGQGLLIGQFATDGVQGILLADSKVDEYNSIMKIKDPHQRTIRMMEFARSAIIDSALLYVSVKSTSKDMDAGRDFKQLKDKSKNIDVNKPVEVTGKSDSKMEVTVQDQGMVKENSGASTSRLTARSAASEGKLPPKSSSGDTGMPDQHFRIFRGTAVEEQMYILVRNSNPACIKYIKMGYPAKPMSVKAKTGKAKHGGSTDGIATVKQSNGILDDSELSSALKDPNNYVVIKDNSGNYVAKNSEGRYISVNKAKNTPYTAEELGWVVDGKTKLPFTGDYDLQDVFFREGTKYKTRNGQEIEMMPGKAALWDVSKGKQDITNPWIKKIKSLLNQKLTKVEYPESINKVPQERVLHGADAGFAPAGDNITVFRPDGTTELLKTRDDVKAWYDRIGRKTRFD
jgi:hypothetical protein